MKANLLKISVALILLYVLIGSSYLISNNSDQLTQNKIQFSQFNGSSNFIGRLNLWYFFATKNDWDNAAKFESNLTQIQNFKINNQPEKLSQKIADLKSKNNKDAQDYLNLAKTQSILGLNKDAIESIKQAHQLDPIRPDLDQLFYSVTSSLDSVSSSLSPF